MKKIILSILVMILAFGTISHLNAQANTQLDTEDNIVIIELTSRYNLPKELVLGQDLPTYEYEGETIPDFRRYFEVSVNREVVLNVHSTPAIDKGGYEWNFAGFDINRLGTNPVILTYGSKFLRINFTIVATDEISPFVYDPDRPTETTFPENFTIEAGRNIATQFVKFRIRDNIDDDRMLVILNPDNTYRFNEEYFEGFEVLEEAELNTYYPVIVTFEDLAGNIFTQTINIRVIDTTPPTIYNVPNIEIKKGTIVDYKENVRLEDNYTKELNDFIIVYDIVDEDNTVIGNESDIEGLFNTLGEHRIRLRVTDESNNTSTRIIRLVVKNPISIGEIILYINLAGIGVTAIGVGVFFIVKRKRVWIDE